MQNPSRKYKSKEIIKLSQALQENDTSYDWLKEHNCMELAAVADIISHDNKTARRWLIQKRHNTLLNFIKAVEGDREAFRELLNNFAPEWAGTISIINQSKDAYNWLIKNKLNHHILLGQVISSLSADPSSSLYISLGAGSSFSGGSGGFGGFGGGSFGGGGAGGSW